MSFLYKPRRVILLIVLLVVQSIALTGCWSRVEINDRLLIVAMYIDQAPDSKIQLTLGYAKPNQMSSQSDGQTPSASAPYATASGYGRNISEAYHNIQTNISREIFWGQVKIILVGEKYARKGIRPILDFVNRKSGIPLKAYLLVVKGEAKGVSEFPTHIEKFPSEVFRELITHKKTIDGSVKHFLIAQEYGKGMIVGYVGPNPDKSQGVQVKVLGTALFQDNRMVGTLDSHLTRGAMWLRGNIKDAMVTIPSPTDGKVISCLVLTAKSKIVPHLRANGIVYNLKLKIESIIDSSDSEIDLENPAVIENLEKVLSERIEVRIHEAFDKSLELGTDAFQFGAYLVWYYPKQWRIYKEDWISVYKGKVEFVVETDAKIRLLGAVKNPLEVNK